MFLYLFQDIMILPASIWLLTMHYSKSITYVSHHRTLITTLSIGTHKVLAFLSFRKLKQRLRNFPKSQGVQLRQSSPTDHTNHDITLAVQYSYNYLPKFESWKWALHWKTKNYVTRWLKHILCGFYETRMLTAHKNKSIPVHRYYFNVYLPNVYHMASRLHTSAKHT